MFMHTRAFYTDFYEKKRNEKIYCRTMGTISFSLHLFPVASYHDRDK